jgi:hypothetical protein
MTLPSYTPKQLLARVRTLEEFLPISGKIGLSGTGGGPVRKWFPTERSDVAALVQLPVVWKVCCPTVSCTESISSFEMRQAKTPVRILYGAALPKCLLHRVRFFPPQKIPEQLLLLASTERPRLS